MLVACSWVLAKCTIAGNREADHPLNSARLGEVYSGGVNDAPPISGMPVASNVACTVRAPASGPGMMINGCFWKSSLAHAVRRGAV